MEHIDIYTLPDCGGCERLKQELPHSDLNNVIEFKNVKGNKENLHFVKDNGFSDIPLIHIYNDTDSRFLIGYHPVSAIKDEIDKLS